MKIDGKRSQSQIKNGDILLSYIGLLCQGNTPVFLKQTLKLSHQLTDKQLLIRMDAGHVTTHGRRIILAIGCSNICRHAFMNVYNRFAMI